MKRSSCCSRQGTVGTLSKIAQHESRINHAKDANAVVVGDSSLSIDFGEVCRGRYSTGIDKGRRRMFAIDGCISRVSKRLKFFADTWLAALYCACMPAPTCGGHGLTGCPSLGCAICNSVADQKSAGCILG